MTKLSCTLLAGTVFLASACSQTTTPPQPQTPKPASARVTSECALLTKAMTSAANGTTPNTQIVMGCPGYENVKSTDNRFSGAGKFLSAASVEIPTKADTKFGKIIFQRMISRGVPQEIAVQMVATPEFDAAVAAYNNPA